MHLCFSGHLVRTQVDAVWFRRTSSRRSASQAIWFEHRWTSYRSQLTRFYISNIRLYTDIADIPEDCKANVDFDYPENAGHFKAEEYDSIWGSYLSDGGYFADGHPITDQFFETSEAVESLEQLEGTFPLNTRFNVNFVPNDDFKFEGWTATTEDGTPVISNPQALDGSISGTSLSNYPLAKSGNVTFKVNGQFYAPAPDA